MFRRCLFLTFNRALVLGPSMRSLFPGFPPVVSLMRHGRGFCIAIGVGNSDAIWAVPAALTRTGQVIAENPQRYQHIRFCRHLLEFCIEI